MLAQALKATVRRDPRITLEGIQVWAHTKSSEAVEKMVQQRLENSMYVVPGLKVVQEDGEATVQFAGSCECTQSQLDLRGCVGHPAILDERGASVIHWLYDDLKVFHVGAQLDCLLVMSVASDDYMVTWADGAPQFKQWDPRGGATIYDLRDLQSRQQEDDVPMAQVASESKRKGCDRSSGEENTHGHEGNGANMTDGAAARLGEEEDVGAPRKKTATTHE